MSSTEYLNLDEVKPDQTEFVITYKGEQHKLKELTVEDFITQTQLATKMGIAASYDVEIDTLMAMVTLAFPSLTRDKLVGLTLAQLNAIVEFGVTRNGTQKAKEAAEALANPQSPAEASSQSTSPSSSAG